MLPILLITLLDSSYSMQGIHEKDSLPPIHSVSILNKVV